MLQNASMLYTKKIFWFTYQQDYNDHLLQVNYLQEGHIRK